ncbi:MAG: YjjG family noncanonical pyrimidine nucleotidase [Cytophagaceae bacterium]|nr:YjjG family noncanonical pyrimidine nucleotidase [Cytophagaceae bacterium]
MAYKHLFFDLDHTLWDFERNSNETLAELYDEFHLAARGLQSLPDFQRVFCAANLDLWRLYDTNQISQTELRHSRFRRVFSALGVQTHDCCDPLNEAYLSRCPQKSHLIEYARELLDYLAPRYQLHIITNGFDEVQTVKMNKAGLLPYFYHVTTSQNSGAKKPDPRIFNHALHRAGAGTRESLMIGDNCETDIAGGRAAGLDTVFYNPARVSTTEQPTYTIHHLRDLVKIL